MNDLFVCRRVLVQVAVKGFDSHIAPIRNKVRHSGIRIIAHGFEFRFKFGHGFGQSRWFFSFIMIFF